MNLQSGDTVLVRHRVSTIAGEVLESSFEKPRPFRFTIDSNRVIKGMNNTVKNLEIGQKVTVRIPAAEAHGKYDERRYRLVKKTAFYQNIKIGQTITFQGELGEPIPAKVMREEGECYVLDTNHPLAGQDLMLEIELVDILPDSVREPFI